MPTNSMRRRPVRLLAAAAATLLVLAACGGGPEEPTAVVPPPAAPPVTVTETPSESPTTSATPSESAGPSASASASPSESAPAEGTVIKVNLVAGKPEPKLELNQKIFKGDTVTIEITTDQAQELHVHGFDFYLKAAPGETVRKTFVADKSGSYEVEVHGTGRLLFNLQVS